MSQIIAGGVQVKPIFVLYERKVNRVSKETLKILSISFEIENLKTTKNKQQQQQQKRLYRFDNTITSNIDQSFHCVGT